MSRAAHRWSCSLCTACAPQDCRRNVFFTASGEVAFHSASLVVLYEPKRHTQRFLRGHDGEVRCLALHPTGRVLASGQAAGGRTEICVWQLDASEPAILSGSHAGGVCALAFSPTGDRLASLGADSSLVLWDWKAGSALASKSAHGEPLFALAWSPVESMLATVGVRCVKLWAVDADGKGLNGRSAQLLPSKAGESSFPLSESNGAGKRGGSGAEKKKRGTTFLCCAFLQSGLLVGGTSRGEVWCWSGTALCARFRAHDGPIFCLEVEPSEGWLLSGGKDGRLRLWSPSIWPAAPATGAASAGSPSPLRMVDLRKLAMALADSAGRPRLLGTRTLALCSSPPPASARPLLPPYPCFQPLLSPRCFPPPSTPTPAPHPHPHTLHTRRHPCLRSLHWVGSSILMSTRAGELLHLDYTSSSELPDVTLLLSGHCQLSAPPAAMRPASPTHGAAGDTPAAAPASTAAGHRSSLGALAAHPTPPLLASASTDLTIRLWDVQQRQMEAMRMLPSAATALAFAPTTETLACALGSEGLLLLDASSLHDLLSIPLSNGSIGATDATALAFSPDGALLAVGTGAGVIELRTAGGAWEVVGACGAHSSPVTSIDWSDDGAALQSNDAYGQLLFWDAHTCAQLDPSASAQYGWASASCPKQWALGGLPRALGHPSLLGPTVRAHGGGAVVCAGADGALTLMGYPSTGEAPASLRYAEHKARLRSACFSSDDQLLISLSETGSCSSGATTAESLARRRQRAPRPRRPMRRPTTPTWSVSCPSPPCPEGEAPGRPQRRVGRPGGRMAGAPAPARSRWRR